MNIKRILIFLIFFISFFYIEVEGLNKAPIDITNMDLNNLNEALDLEIITSEELVNLYLDRINEYDKNYHSIIIINKDALIQAKKLDQERKKGKVRSLLHGIPIIVKDNIDVKGLPTTAGAKALSDNYPKYNAFVIQKLIDAGAIILAKANMSEFAFSARVSNSTYGAVRNAYNLDYSPYGSSGGSAVAVSASFAAAALGTDTNSSIRLPAAANYLIGLRPTVGLVSRTGTLPYDPQRDTIGTLTKRVSDAIILMNIINGYDKNDEKSIKQKPNKYKITRKDLDGITIGIPTDFLSGSNKNQLIENQETYTEIKILMEKAIANLKAKKASIIYLDQYYNYDTSYWSSKTLSGNLFCNAFNDYIKNTTGKIRDFQTLALSSGISSNLSGEVSSCGAQISMVEKNKLKKEYEEYIKDIMKKNNLDVIAYPASKNKLAKFNNITNLINLSSHASSTINYPAITLPLGFDKDKLPYGIEFMAPNNQEQLLLNIASIYEKNYLELKSPKITPSLYKIPNEVKQLVLNYKDIVQKKDNYFFEKKWLKEVKNYFRNYSQNQEVDSQAQTLVTKYQINKIFALLFAIILFIIKFIIIAVISLIILIIIIRYFYKIKRRFKRKRKRH